MSSSLPSIFGLHGDALALRQQRMQLLASNIANADTPLYKARDLNFEAALRSAVNEQAMAELGHVDRAPPPPQSFEFARVPLQPSLDGNTVDAELENAAFAKGALEYRASLGFIESRVKTLLLAITGQ